MNTAGRPGVLCRGGGEQAPGLSGCPPPSLPGSLRLSPLPGGWKHKALQGRLQPSLCSQLILIAKLPVPGSLQRGGPPHHLQLRGPLGITSRPGAGRPPTPPTPRSTVAAGSGSNPQPESPGLLDNGGPGLALPPPPPFQLAPPPLPFLLSPCSHPQPNCGFCLGNALLLARERW